MSYGAVFASAVDATGGTLTLPVGTRDVENLRPVGLVESGVVLAEVLDLPLSGGFRRGACWGLLVPADGDWLVVLMGTTPEELAGDGLEIGRLTDDDVHRWGPRFRGRDLRVAVVIDGTPGLDRVEVRFRSDLLTRTGTPPSPVPAAPVPAPPTVAGWSSTPPPVVPPVPGPEPALPVVPVAGLSAAIAPAVQQDRAAPTSGVPAEDPEPHAEDTGVHEHAGTTVDASPVPEPQPPVPEPVSGPDVTGSPDSQPLAAELPTAGTPAAETAPAETPTAERSAEPVLADASPEHGSRETVAEPALVDASAGGDGRQPDERPVAEPTAEPTLQPVSDDEPDLGAEHGIAAVVPLDEHSPAADSLAAALGVGALAPYTEPTASSAEPEDEAPVVLTSRPPVTEADLEGVPGPPPPAGWYVDPHDAQFWRYWDGTQWTPAAAAHPLPTAP